MARMSDEKLKEFKGKMGNLRQELEEQIVTSVRSMVADNEHGELPLSDSMRDRLVVIQRKINEAVKASEELDDSIREMIDLRNREAKKN